MLRRQYLRTPVASVVRGLATLAQSFNIPSDFQSRTPPYAKLIDKLSVVRRIVNSPLTLAEKILYSHLVDVEESLGSCGGKLSNIRGEQYLKLNPDRVAMQDASAQMALLQFMTCGMSSTAVPASIHCDHLIVGKDGADDDLVKSIATNKEVFDFLQSCGEKYGIQFWGPGSGIIHQIVLENFSTPGLMMLGTDSHTPNAGGLGAIAIGVGGADAVDALTGTPWELKAPKVLGVKLTGHLSGWSSPKDVITTLAGILTVRGGTGFIVEYFGEGVKSLSCTGMATICNMGAEIGATTSTFPYQEAHKKYLIQTNRAPVAEAADIANNEYGFLQADEGAEYDKIIEVDLSSLEPHVNGPFTPDLSTPISKFGETAAKEGWPEKVSAGLIGSCTNSSYQDMSRAASIIRQAEEAGLKPKIPFFVTPGSEQIRATIERDGLIHTFEKNGAIVLANACGPCIGQWDRTDVPKTSTDFNAIFTSFNRNFRARNDGNRNTMNFLTSPDMVTAMIYSGDMNFNPMTDTIRLQNGEEFRFNPPQGEDLPSEGFIKGRLEFYPEPNPQPKPEVSVNVSPESDRLQLLEPFEPWSGEELSTNVLLKVEGKCTTDHISAAGAWLKYKGHLENISYNTLIGAVNKETGEVNKAYDLNGDQYGIPELMIKWKEDGRPWIVVAEHNYGEGSAREHAALSPRFLNGSIILVKSFARIHETNLKKQGMLPLTFADENDYDRISAGDLLTTVDLRDMVAKNGDNGGTLHIKVTKRDGTEFTILCKHTMSKDQIEFFKAGSAINYIGNLRRAQEEAAFSVFVCTLGNEVLLELFQELQGQFVFGGQCFFTNDGLHGGRISTDGVFSVQLIGHVTVVLSGHSLTDGRLHQTGQRGQHVDGRVYTSVGQLTVDENLALGDVAGQIRNGVGDVVVGHGQDGDLGDGTVTALDSSSSLINGRQIGVHITRVTSSAGNLLSGSRHFSQGVGVRRHVGQNGQNVLFSLVGQVLSRGQRQTRSDDSLNGRIVGQVQEQRGSLQRAVLFEILLEEPGRFQVGTHSCEHNGEIVLVAVVDVLGGPDQAGLTTDLGCDLVVRQSRRRKDGNLLSSGDGVHGVYGGDTRRDHFLRIDTGVGVDGRAVDVQVVLGKDTRALVDGSSRTVENTTQHVFRDWDSHRLSGEFNSSLLDVDARRSLKHLHNGLGASDLQNLACTR